MADIGSHFETTCGLGFAASRAGRSIVELTLHLRESAKLDMLRLTFCFLQFTRRDQLFNMERRDFEQLTASFVRLGCLIQSRISILPRIGGA
jgi:hypothetical protein